MNKPVLFLVFNRFDTTKEVFEQIRLAKPKKLYIASDGPRNNVDGEDEKVTQTRKWILDNIDWECSVKTRFSDCNQGCGKAISSAVSWFFKQEPEGIILEDDCVPSQSFFKFCEELLNKYRNDKRIWHISGDGFYEDGNVKESYYFAKIMHCWGWAGWADRWEKYKFDLDWFDEKFLANFSNRYEVQDYFKEILHKMKNNEIDTWDYQWTFTIAAQKGLCINPYKNLVKNIGYIGVHFNDNNPLAGMQTFEIKKIIHPKIIKYNHKAIDYIYTNILGIAKENKTNCLFKKEKQGNQSKITILGFIKFAYKK